MSKVINRIQKHRAVACVVDERNSDNGVWAELKVGFIDQSSGCHAIHEDTPTEVYRRLTSVIPCNCNDCKN